MNTNKEAINQKLVISDELGAEIEKHERYIMKEHIDSEGNIIKNQKCFMRYNKSNKLYAATFEQPYRRYGIPDTAYIINVLFGKNKKELYGFELSDIIGKIFIMLRSSDGSVNIGNDNELLYPDGSTKVIRSWAELNDSYLKIGRKNTSYAFKKLLREYNILREVKTEYDFRGGRKKGSEFLVNPLIYSPKEGMSIIATAEFYESVTSNLKYTADVYRMNKIIKMIRIDNGLKDDIDDTEFILELMKESTVEPAVESNVDIIEENNSDNDDSSIFDSLFDDDDDIERANIAMFNRNVLKRDNVSYMSFENGKAIRVSNIEEGKNLYVQINASTTSNSVKLNNNSVDIYNSWYLDFDATKDEEGNYLPLDKVDEQKLLFMSIISNLPASFVVETRDGYHAYFPTANNSDINASEWQMIEDMLHAITGGVADEKVKDACRVMRAPGSYWSKNPDVEGYGSKTSILITTDRLYTPIELCNELKECKDNENLNLAISTYKSKYSSNKKPSTSNASSSNVSNDAKLGNKKSAQKKITLPTGAVIYSDNQYTIDACRDIANKVSFIKREDGSMLNVFSRMALSVAVTYVNTVNEAKEIVKSKMDIAKLLRIDNPACFCDIFHPDHNPSACISNRYEDRYAYCAFSGNKADFFKMRDYVDIIDIVMYLQQSDFKSAMDYLFSIAGIVIGESPLAIAAQQAKEKAANEAKAANTANVA